jgi:phosphate transport system substrate-binding protein
MVVYGNGRGTVFQRHPPRYQHRLRISLQRVFFSFSLLLLILLPIMVRCGAEGSKQEGVACPAINTLIGSGSTFDYPLFSKMFSEYLKVPCGVTVTYHSVGSGTGINDLFQQRVDFAASDSPLTDEQMAPGKRGNVLHIPVTLGIIAMTYNLPGVNSHVKLTGPLIAEIYLGHIAFWDDPALTAINAGLALPHLPIVIVHRTDGSGTTSIFTHYLSAVSQTWQATVGAGIMVPWPVQGVGRSGNAATANVVKQTPGAISYNELTYVVANFLPYALIQNAAGRYLEPSLDGARAATNVPDIPADLRFYIVNTHDRDGYPISGFSWVLVYQDQPDAQKGQALARLFWWMIHDGQQYATALIYASLPQRVIAKEEEQIKKMRCGPKPTPCFQQ